MEKTFVKAADSVARKMLAANAERGICLNGSNLDAAAGTTGFQAVTATDVARSLQDEARDNGKRWRNCNHDTASDALVTAGWHLVWVRGKRFLLLDVAEARRLKETAEGKRAARTAQIRAQSEKRAALRANGPTGEVRVYYARPKNAYRSGWKPRVTEVLASEVLAFAAKAAKAGKAVRIVLGSEYTGGVWEWRREEKNEG